MDLWKLRESLLSLIPEGKKEEFFSRELGNNKRYKKKDRERGDVIDGVLRLYAKETSDPVFLLLYQRLKKEKERLFKENLPLVWKVMRDMRVMREDRDDAFQVGCIGLMKGIELYQPHKGEFGTVAYNWIKASIVAFLRKEKNYRRTFCFYEQKISEDSRKTYLDLFGVNDYALSENFDVNIDNDYTFSRNFDVILDNLSHTDYTFPHGRKGRKRKGTEKAEKESCHIGAGLGGIHEAL